MTQLRLNPSYSAVRNRVGQLVAEIPGVGQLAGASFRNLTAAIRELVEPHVGEFRAGVSFTRYYWQLELDEQLRPTGRDIVEPPGPPAPRA